jgi:hypothetical protein
VTLQSADRISAKLSRYHLGLYRAAELAAHPVACDDPCRCALFRRLFGYDGHGVISDALRIIETVLGTQETERRPCVYSAAMVPLCAGALAKIAANSSLLTLAPPTSAPPTSGSARIARAFVGLTEPP